MNRPILPALLALALSSVGLAQTTVWSANGHSYEVRVRPAGIDWNTAQAECQADGGYLGA